MSVVHPYQSKLFNFNLPEVMDPAPQYIGPAHAQAHQAQAQAHAAHAAHAHAQAQAHAAAHAHAHSHMHPHQQQHHVQQHRYASPHLVHDMAISFQQQHHDTPLLSHSPDPSVFMAGPPTPPEGMGTPSRGSPGLGSPMRTKSARKPDRDVIRTQDGRFCCSWPDCNDEPKIFSRKCEWSKHMDKHDRPYRCDAVGCEKQPGFTYSGGLLRHEREVHGKHGGPKNPLNCPHPNCKRHSGKGFSRLENLNEHLRRVHTPNAAEPENGDDDADDSNTASASHAVAGGKRKADDDMRDEVKRLQMENMELRQQVEAQKRAQIAMMQNLNELQDTFRPSSYSVATDRDTPGSLPGDPNAGAHQHSY